MKNQKKLFLLDAYALIYRAYFAFIKNPRINSKGINTSAIFGFSNTLIEVLKKEKPSHIAVVFDTKEPTERHIIYPEYKAQREAMPEDLSSSLIYIDRLLDAFNISKIFKHGYEADDVIGTIAKKAEKEGFEVYMMTLDKDFAQLVSENIFMYRPANKWKPNEIWGVKEVLERFSIKKINQVIDLLGMMGDSSDNIPGILGVGQKTAVKFISEYGSMEELFRNTDKLKGKIREKVENGKEIGLLSKKLVTIITDVPIEVDLEDLKLKRVNKSKLHSLFQELEFRRLLESFLKKEESNPQEEKKISNINLQMNLFDSVKSKEAKKDSLFFDKNYQSYKTIEEVNKLVDSLQKKDTIAIDLALTEDPFHIAEIIGLAISEKKNKSSYVSFTKTNEEHFLALLKKIFTRKDLTMIGFDLKKQIKVLAKKNIFIQSKIFDIRIAYYLLYPEIRNSLDFISENILEKDFITFQDFQGKGRLKKQLKDISYEDRKNYISQHADVILQIYSTLKQRLKDKNIWKLFKEIEMPLVKVLAKMEFEGITLDKEALFSYSKTLNNLELNYSQNIYELADIEFNINSPKQLGEILFEKMQLDKKAKKTKSGNFSTSEDSLKKLKDKHKIIDFILEYREIKKLLSTYVDALPRLCFNGKIHTTFSQSVTATGRLSSVSPNLQNIPIRSTKGKKIREAFVPKNQNYKLLAADYSQIELRIMASLSGDKQMIQAFKNGEDIHSTTAAKVYKTDIQNVTKTMRSNAKSVNFGIIYGISAFGLAQNIGCSRKEAKEIIDQYFIQFPNIKKYMDWSISQAREKEYAETAFGRKRILRDINSRNAVIRNVAERNAINTPIQGTAADIIKRAMIDIQKEIDNQNLKSKMLLQVHDELVFDMFVEEENLLKNLVKQKMEQSASLKVPLVVDLGVGENWLEAH